MSHLYDDLALVLSSSSRFMSSTVDDDELSYPETIRYRYTDI